MRGALDDGDLAAEAAHGLRHLHTDRAAAENQQAPRDRLHAGDLAVGPDALELAQPGDRRHEGIRARGEHDVVGGVAHAVDLDDAHAGEPAAAAKQVDPLVGEPALLTGVGVVRDHGVAPGERRGDIDLGAGRRLARAVHGLAGRSSVFDGMHAQYEHSPPTSRAPRARRADHHRQARRRSARPASRRQ